MTIYLKSEGVVLLKDKKVAADKNCCCDGDCEAEVIAEFTVNPSNPIWDITIYASRYIDSADGWELRETGHNVVYQRGAVIDHHMQGLAVFKQNPNYHYNGYMRLSTTCSDGGGYGGY